VIALARSRAGAALVLATLFAGVLWMLGAAAWVGVRTNFLNFIALPITFGIGVDYGINIYLRYRLEGRGRVGRAVRATGGAVALLRAGELVAFPTETVYGLGGRALDPAALARIFAAKGRPATHPLIAHVRGAADAQPLAATWDERAAALAERFWPGPLTLVVP